MHQIIFSAMTGAVSGFILGLVIIISLSTIGSMNGPMMDDKYGTALIMVLTAIGLLVGFAYGMVHTDKNQLNSR